MKLRKPAVTVGAAALVLAATLAALPGTAAAAPRDGAAGPAGEGVPRLRVLSHNVFLMSRNLYPNWGQDHRAEAVPAAGFFAGNDVVVLQEAFDNPSSEALKQAAADRYPYQTPVVGRSRTGWDATGGGYSALTPEDGGVTVLSKWPVLRREQVVFDDACGSDAMSNKGFAYVVLDVDGTRAHVVGVHTQSTDPGCAAGAARAVRARQFRQLDAFLDGKHIPAGEQVLVAGDMNVDGHGDEYAAMLEDADLVPADARTGHPYSFDTTENSVAADRYPGEPSEDLDHVLHRAGHARPRGWTNEVLPVDAEPWTVRSWGRTYTYTDLSDHYPVRAG